MKYFWQLLWPGVQLLFIYLKLTEQIDWNWFLVLLPMMAPFLLIGGIVLAVIAGYVLVILFGCIVAIIAAILGK